MTPAADTHAKSALRALDVLELLGRHVSPVPTGAIARECDIPRSSTHHLLNALLNRGFIIYYESEHAWGIGPKLIEVSRGYDCSDALQRLANPVLDKLADQAGETAHLATLVGTDVLYLAKRQSRGPSPKLVTEVGVRLPAHLAATGRAILATLTPEQLNALYPDGRMPSNRTGTGPHDLTDLARTLGDVRDRGHALEHGTVSRGISCVAASVTLPNTLMTAAIGLSWISSARTDHDVTAFTEGVQRAAGHLQQLIAGGLPQPA